jgi:UDP-GlcNAc:undecaprenyl-phosphate/decaprenyl-phosphate GlcNAc-1-phosphate transferase
MNVTDVVATVGGGVMAWASLGFVPKWLKAPIVTNYRGRPVPVVLGWGLAVGVCTVVLAEPIGAALGHRPVPSDQFVLAGAVGAIFLVGLYDDRKQHPVRGVIRQFREVLRGRITPGIVKMVVIVGAALAWTVVAPVPASRVLLGTLLIAGAANLWNLFDVKPGRALKYGIVAGAAVLAATVTALLGATVGASLALLPADLGERAMLGDSGANVLGFMVGIGLFDQLGTSDVGLGVALGVILVLHALAETVTLSRIIRAILPLRWFDELWCYEAPGSSDSMESRSA